MARKGDLSNKSCIRFVIVAAIHLLGFMAIPVFAEVTKLTCVGTRALKNGTQHRNQQIFYVDPEKKTINGEKVGKRISRREKPGDSDRTVYVIINDAYYTYGIVFEDDDGKTVWTDEIDRQDGKYRREEKIDGFAKDVWLGECKVLQKPKF